jgi:hypothetical protein
VFLLSPPKIVNCQVKLNGLPKNEVGKPFEKQQPFIHYSQTKKQTTMKVFKSIALMFVAAMITLGANAQTATTTTKTDSKATKTETKPASKDGKAATATTKTETKASSTKTETKPAAKDEKKGDGRTKTGDAINKDLKGPKGETVYTGPKGGNYYLSKEGNKVYLKK